MKKRTRKGVEEEELSLDLSALTTFFKKADKDVLVTWCLVIAAMAIVFFVRMQPAALPITDDWAEQSIRQSIRNQVATQVNQQFPSLPQVNKDALINERAEEFYKQNKDQFEASRDEVSQQIKTRLRYDVNGKEYTYLGDLDSYFWLRYTRNWLNTGMTCDYITDEGGCHDGFVLAPVGQPARFNPSTHVFAIAFLYKFITIFNKDFPLLATSFLVPVLAGVLGVFPAFFIGRRLAGNVGGVFAAILISLHPLVLSRSMGSDNDVWNTVVPLFILWMAVEAIDAKDTKRSLIYGSLTGFAVAVYSTFWTAWWFIYLIILLGMVGGICFLIAKFIWQKRDVAFWKDKEIQGAAIVLGSFYVVAMIFLLLLGERTIGQYVAQPLTILSAGANLDRAIADAYWPNVLTTVAELNKSHLGAAISQAGGQLFFFGSLVGLLLMLLPRKRWKWHHFGILGLGAAISFWLVKNPGGSKFFVLSLIGLPIAIALLTYLFFREKARITDAMIILVWFLATIYSTYSGVRFILLMIPAYGIAFGVLAGRIYEWTTSYLNKEFKWHRYITNAIVFALLVFLLVNPVKAGYGTARGFVPSIDDAWWDSLTKIKEESQPDAIINSWWDFGHWFKYVAERRVTADGTTQGTHVPRWLGKALVTPDERESIGILRMLNCGSDAYPTPFGDQGAYGKILNKTGDVLLAQQMVVDIVQLDEEEARAYLDDHGFTKKEQDNVLASSHCESPEDFFITSGDMIGKAGVWAHFGLWDFDKAYSVQTVKELPQDEAMQALMEKLNFTEDEARTRYFEILGLQSEGDINAYVSPWPGYITGNWRPCTTDNITFQCSVGAQIGQQGPTTTNIDGFIFNSTNITASVIVLGTYQNGQRIQVSTTQPFKVIVANETGLYSQQFDAAVSTSISVLLDTEYNRALVGDHRLLESMFTRLFYLQGRYAEYYEPFDDRTTFSGSRILVWKVNWDGKDE